jgi:diaminohydroxyphosphoribosylaminopyrimidine deaminase / 5-amino-6-(5-phosphoribosylamino)uracil reductase
MEGDAGAGTMAERAIAADAGFMARALELAETGWGRVHPNPLVGAVVVRDGEIVGQGAHREYGGAHAEVEALRSAGGRAKGGTLYVTLEPCAHHGKTPPCTDAVLSAGIRRLVYAAADPDPLAGGGAARLEAAGVEVVGGIERDAARSQNALFLQPLERGTPFIALKYGLSLDARIARMEGERTRVTGPESEAEVHRLRAGFDVVLVGGRTARTDDPLLTARGTIVPRIPPVRAVLSTRADLPPDGRLVATADVVPTWLITGDAAPDATLDALTRRGVRVLQVPGGGAVPDPSAVVRMLADQGIGTILCEGGGRLGSALLAAGLVDRLYLFHAPVLFGERGVPAFRGDDLQFHGRLVGVRPLGDDTLTIVDRSL